MTKPLKIALIAVAALLGLLLVALLALVLLVDPNRFKPQLIAAAQQQTGRELRIDGELGWSFYPILGIELGGVELANARGFGDGPMLAVQRIAVGVELLPLLRGELNVSQLRLEQPRIDLAKDAQGRSNWDDILEHRRQLDAAREPAAKAPAGTGPDDDIRIAISGLQLVGAELRWRDAQQRQDLLIAPLDLQTGAIRPGEPVALTLSLGFASGEQALRATLKLDTELSIGDGFDTLAWRDLTVALTANGAALPGELTAQLRGDGRVDLGAQTLALDESRIEFKLPADGIDSSGELRLALRGDLAKQRFESERLDLTLTLSGGTFGAKQNVTLRTPLTLDLQRQTLALPAIVASGAGIELKARVDGRQIVDKPAFSGTFDIAALPLRKLLDDLKIELPPMADARTLQRVSLQGEFAATPQRVELNPLRATIDDSTLRGRLSTGLGDITRLGFDLTLDRIDLDRYLPPADAAPSAPASKPAGSAPAGGSDQTFAFLDTLALDGRIAIGQLHVRQLDLRDVALTARSSGRQLTLDPLTASLYGGRAELRVDIDARGAQPRTRVRSNLQQVQIGALLDAWLQKRGPIEGTGSLRAELDFSGLDVAAILASLGGSGELRLGDGAVRGVNVAQEIRNALAVIRRQPRQQSALKTDFTELVVPFRVSDGSFNWSQLNASSPLLRVGSNGSLNLRELGIDTKLDVTIVRSLKGQGGESLGELAGLLVPVTLRGAVTAPKVSVDLAKVLEQTALGERQKELEAELREKAKAREDELKEKAKEREDELKQKATKELQRGLDKLLRAPKSDKPAAGAAAPAEAAD